MINIEEKIDKLEQLIKSQELQQKEVLSLPEAAAYLKISVSQMYKLSSKKRVTYYCPGGKKIYFKKSDLDAWLLSNEVQSIESIDKKAANYVLTKKGGCHGR